MNAAIGGPKDIGARLFDIIAELDGVARVLEILVSESSDTSWKVSRYGYAIADLIQRIVKDGLPQVSDDLDTAAMSLDGASYILDELVGSDDKDAGRVAFTVAALLRRVACDIEGISMDLAKEAQPA